MNNMHWLRRLPFLFLLLLATSAAFAQVPAGIDPGQLTVLQDLSDEDRQELLDTLIENAGTGAQSPLSTPELLRRDDATDEDEPEGIQVFDSQGRPYLDEVGMPIFLTQEMFEEMQTQTIEELLENAGDFFEQDIRLERFGYNLFEGVPTTFAPATDIPVPNEYRLGPGDTIDVQLFGKENRQYSLVVSRDGTVNFPSIGPVNVMGQNFQSLKQDILDLVAEQLIGTSASVTMGSLRSINVLVVGDASRPGSYTVSGLSTITNALLASGGVADVGSLRNIQLKRAGKVVTTLDLYKLLLEGDSGNDLRLESGDVIFVPPVGETVGVGGFVKRPAIYELKGERTIAEVVALAGGLRSDAFAQGARVERFDEEKDRSFFNVDLTSTAGLQKGVVDGDTLLVPPVFREFRGGVRVSGNVRRPGVYQWEPGIRLTDLLGDLKNLQPQTDLNYLLIRRVARADGRIEVLSADLARAVANPASQENVLLEPRDEISVFRLGREDPEGPRAELDRKVVVSALLEELRRQANAEIPFEQVTIAGEIGVPGNYPREAGMTVSDLLRAGGGFAQSAFPLFGELTRFSVIDNSYRAADLRDIDLQAALRGDPTADLVLEPGDFLTVRRLENWENRRTVTIGGEVRFPGTYTIRDRETLSSVIARAGGLTKDAFPEGSIFTREQLRIREQEQIDTLRERLQSDLASLGLQAAGALEGPSVLDAQSAGSGLLATLNATEAAGRLVIDLPALLADPGNLAYDVLLEADDQLLVPRTSQSVTVIGEVQFPTSHLFEKGLDRKGYIDRSGGMTPNASKRGIYVVKANGRVLADNSRFFRKSSRIEAGDTIVVPLDTQRGFRLQAWSSVTTILYNTAIAIAAINGLSN